MTLALAGGGLIALAFAISAALGGLARFVAPRVGLVDNPGGRKTHRAPTPLGGGVAIWLTSLIVLALGAVAVGPGQPYLPEALAQHAGGLLDKAPPLAIIFALATAIMAMGLVDDRVGLGWKLRLAVQLALAAILAASGVRITLFPPFSGPLAGGVLTVLWVVGLTNAFNFLDNMDGLAAGVGLIAAGLFAAAQVAVGGLFVPAVLLTVVGALGGFLVHNRYPARLFMGDAGSNFIGFLLGALTVAGTFHRPGYSKLSVLAPLLVMAVPLYDTTSVILIRLREGRSPFQADRRHFSHRLVDRGLTPPHAVGTIDLVTLASGLGALLLSRPGLGWLGGAVVLAQAACLLGLVAIFESSPTRPEPGDVDPKPEAGPAPQGSPPTAL